MSKQEKSHIIRKIIENSNVLEIGMGIIIVTFTFCVVALTVLAFITNFTK